MSRGDNRPRSVSGRASSGQNRPHFSVNQKRRRSNHHKTPNGGWSSELSQPDPDFSFDHDRGGELKTVRGGERTFNLLVDSVPYVVKALPFTFNGAMRYRVSYNGSPKHVFTSDSTFGQLRAIDNDSSTLPDNLEIAISAKLQSAK